MARYISRAPRFKKTGRHARHSLVTTAYGTERQLTLEPIVCLFRQGGGTEWEMEQAQARFDIRGASEGETIYRRFSVYDTDEMAKALNWDEETKAEVEGTLDAGQGQDYFRIEKPRAPLPWPAYHDADPGTIADAARIVGVPLESVLAYERENENRLAVVAELEAAIEGDREPDEVIVNA